MGFTAGQQAYSDFFELTLEHGRVMSLQDRAVETGMACHSIKQGRLNICYVICTRYNYWEGCTSHPGVCLCPPSLQLIENSGLAECPRRSLFLHCSTPQRVITALPGGSLPAPGCSKQACFFAILILPSKGIN